MTEMAIFTVVVVLFVVTVVALACYIAEKDDK